MSETLNYDKTSNDLAFTVASPSLVIASSAHSSQNFFFILFIRGFKIAILCGLSPKQHHVVAIL